MTYEAIVHPADEGGFWAEVPALPGCVTQGETLEELYGMLDDAILGWLAADLDIRPIDEKGHSLAPIPAAANAPRPERVLQVA